MRFKKFLFIYIIMFFGIINVKGLNIDLVTSTSISTDSFGELSVKVTLDEGEEPEKIYFKLNYDNTLIKLEEDKADSVGYTTNTGDENKEIWIFSAPKEKFENGNIIKFKVTNLSTVNASATISLSEIKYDETVYEKEVMPKTINLKYVEKTTERIKNTSAKLTNFTVTNSTVKPAFSANIKDYKIYVNKDTIRQITIKPEYEQTGVVLSVNCKVGCTSDSNTPNKLNLVMGKNEATFTFTSEDGANTEVYNFIIYRGETTDGSNKLAELKVTDYEFNEKFNKDVLDYSMTVPYEIEDLDVVASPEDVNADVKIKGNNELKVGENVITITVTSAETEEKNIYNITVTRSEFVPEETTTTTGAILDDDITKDDENNDLILLIIIGIVGTSIIGLSAYLIFFRKKKDKLPKKKKTEELLDNKPEEIEVLDTGKIAVDDALYDLMKTKELEIKK